MSETVLSVKQTDSKMQGTIVTNKRTISYNFDDSYTCCNRYDVNENFPLVELIGKTIVHMNLEEEVEQKQEKIEKNNSEEHNENSNHDCGGKGFFTIQCLDVTYILTMSNYHNGYYAMNFDVMQNGMPMWNIVI